MAGFYNHGDKLSGYHNREWNNCQLPKKEAATTTTMK
jgi:hypothetical protein